MNKLTALVPARSGSERFPGKNVAQLGGHPLIAWTVVSAISAPSVGDVLVSTDSPDIAAIARDYGATTPFLRPASLSAASTRTEEVVLHARKYCKGAMGILVLQPTSPLRGPTQIERFVEEIRQSGAASAFSATSAKHANLAWTVNKDGVVAAKPSGWTPDSRLSQDSCQLQPSGAMYWATWPWLLSGRNLVDVGSQSVLFDEDSSIDVDFQRDLDRVQRVLLHKGYMW